MRAINLIPEDAAGGGSGGNAAYLLLGGLATLLAFVALYVVTGNQVVERKAELASIQAQLQAAQTQAEAVRPYRDFAAMAQARVETIRQLGAARFDWHGTLGELAKVVPGDVWFTSLVGSVAAGVGVSGGSGGTGSLRGAIPGPAIELSGCANGHESVVRLISRLRLMTGVQRVALADSVKSENGGDCNGDQYPMFNLVVFFAAIPTASAPSAGAATATPASGGAATAAPTGADGAPANGAKAVGG